MQYSSTMRRALQLVAAAFAVIGTLCEVNAAAEDVNRSPRPRSFNLVECTLTGIAQPALCGVLDVPENAARPNARTIPLHIAVLPATSARSPANDPIVLLMGGPGEGTIDTAVHYIERLALVHEDRDLLLVDQRGTGRSAALRCELYSADESWATGHSICSRSHTGLELPKCMFVRIPTMCARCI